MNVSQLCMCVKGDRKNTRPPRCLHPNPQICEYVMLYGKLCYIILSVQLQMEINVANQLTTKEARFSWIIWVGAT